MAQMNGMEKRNFTNSARNGGKTAEMRNNSAKSGMVGMSGCCNLTMLQNVYDYHRQSIYDIIVHQYSDWSHGAASNRDRATQKQAAAGSAAFTRDSLASILGDALVVAPVVAMATFHARHSRPGTATYLYEFNQPATAARRDNYQRWVSGSPGDELTYVFGAPLAVQSLQPFRARAYTRTERLLARTVVRYWSNFAKTGSVYEKFYYQSFFFNYK